MIDYAERPTWAHVHVDRRFAPDLIACIHRDVERRRLRSIRLALGPADGWQEIRRFIEALPPSLRIVGLVPSDAVFGPDDVEVAISAVRAARDALGDRLEAIELGNEPEIEAPRRPAAWIVRRLMDLVQAVPAERPALVLPGCSSTPAGRVLFRVFTSLGWPVPVAASIHIYGRVRLWGLWIRTDAPEWRPAVARSIVPVWISETGVRNLRLHRRWWKRLWQDLSSWCPHVRENIVWYDYLMPTDHIDHEWGLWQWHGPGEVRPSPLWA